VAAVLERAEKKKKTGLQRSTIASRRHSDVVPGIALWPENDTVFGEGVITFDDPNPGIFSAGF